MVIIDQKYYSLFESQGIVRHYAPHEAIFMEEDEARYTYLIEEGRVRVFMNSKDGKETTLEILKAGRIFGDASFCEHSLRSVTIEAVVETRLVVVDTRCLVGVLHEHEELMVLMFQHLTESNQRMTHVLKRLIHYDATQKVADFILTSSEEDGTLPFTQQEMSECLALNRVTVSRVITKLKQQGLIQTSYGSIQIRNKQGLKALL
ncbi:MAG: Crp/Fnr family transcriptional regulator [Intestinibaculum porci]|uniref:Crp/Fnr family transcriptional regulator n=1 Tax=Intestinibaculum porci TaxID=2487118 RepID=UPI002409072A|nr:Crp/Fnr family transcriptional regulator [Intestinibaculum porci]MDD6423666.1 Crp/Fnr family transcriptional regulator [Intestinibaculum porci]